MRIAELPNPAPDTVTWITSVEPWQREGLLRLRDVLGVDADALLRAGVTLVLAVVGAITPDAATPLGMPAAHHSEQSTTTNADATLASVGTPPKQGGDARST